MATFLANEIKVNKYYRERHNGPNNVINRSGEERSLAASF